ncbi:uncharacterized protein LOC130983277 isoform X2 [Arachis stenosperma]|uniref:uncharacterized protein LOC130983277 isoform X2 n=1 Tax=Arachis stenosperma TaxID=217475 RepID=UPI0025ABD4B3|nr:uncharacterized protein LOC130983277 isoform X2 [Arachis stenosperma]
MVMAAIRSINTVAEAMPQLTKFSLQAPKLVEVEFADGRVFKLLAEFLRIISPAVDGKIRSIGGNIRETARRNHVCRTGSELWDKSGLCSRQRPLVRRENNCRGARATDGGDNTCDYFVINGIKHLLLTLFSFFLFTIEFLSTLKLAYDAGFNLGEENEKKKEFFRRRNE